MWHSVNTNLFSIVTSGAPDLFKHEGWTVASAQGMPEVQIGLGYRWGPTLGGTRAESKGGSTSMAPWLALKLANDAGAALIFATTYMWSY